tara:strand:+ start:1715 stop:2743 length:1029 start_codon:yes stop_codon:yes gene_type:complete
MAYTTINKSSSFQNQLLWDGTGATNARTGLGFQPDFCWGKERSSTSGSILQDSVQGLSVYLASNSNSGTSPTSVQFTSFDSDGFTLGTSTGINQSGQTNVGWAWKAGTTTGIDTTGATITPSSYSLNATSKMSIIKYTGNDTSNAAVPHGLGVVPDCIIIKDLSGSEHWAVVTTSMTADKMMYLNLTNAEETSQFGSTANTSVLFHLGTNAMVNSSSKDYIAYCFASVKGYSKFGSYSGNSDTNGAFIYTGFKPTWVMIKRTDSADWWGMWDGTRNPSNVVDKRLYAQASDAEGTSTNLDFLANGFKLRSTDGAINSSSGSYIYMAFGQSIVGSNNVPCTAR